MRTYFFLGDALTTGLTGALAGLACLALTGVGWPMLPAMIGGMLSGMVVAMSAARGGVGWIEAALVGAIWSWAALLATGLADAALRGEVER